MGWKAVHRLAMCAVVVALSAEASKAHPAPPEQGVAQAAVPKLEFGSDEMGDARPRVRYSVLRGKVYSDNGTLITVENISRFLAEQRSPMEPYSAHIVTAANRHGVDPRMIVAIAGVESQYGKRCLGFNAWGWNGGKTRWRSWEHSIDEYARLLGSRYPDWRNIRKVAPVYNPNTPEAWGRKVSYLLSQIPAVDTRHHRPSGPVVIVD